MKKNKTKRAELYYIAFHEIKKLKKVWLANLKRQYPSKEENFVYAINISRHTILNTMCCLFTIFCQSYCKFSSLRQANVLIRKNVYVSPVMSILYLYVILIENKVNDQISTHPTAKNIQPHSQETPPAAYQGLTFTINLDHY